ncbi:Stk1 family PASTA domain-containing Ser/Thr kinase [Serinibacter salmoneus]|uniref:non-specific serine/threonine protein kinase n=1 Tax=Serinibacter salmoneus TaxID=556530 RepID=A0A2A9D5I2_9MICO|nr:Stk1 family PASTA domain-containing Ser/Thr kinase [Serinibacter salmoneus]PFG21120.1 serine/threonine-protein kinase [Serinibacter salmoneus]
MADSTPRVLAGRYEVGELIGRGGMAEVLIGRDNRLSRRVAIKVLRADLAQDSTFQARFRREAQSAAALNHPAIVSVYDTGEDTQIASDGSEVRVPFIIMEYVEGHTVRDLLRDGAALPLDEAVEITTGVLSALDYSHHAGIIHRDIKPANVMITTAGDVKVMDFGIARAVADSAATMTQTQAVVGTAQYLSPEQARGEVVDARSDVYSTGVLLFELLTGRPPFQGDSPVAVAYQHVRENPPTPSSIAPDVPEELDRITLKSLAKDKTIRYQSAEEMRADLNAAVRGGVVGAPAVGVIAASNAAANAAQRGAPTELLSATPASTGTTSTAIPAVPEAEEVEEKRGRGWIWALAIIAVLLIGGIIWAAFLRGDGREDVAVPEVVGLTQTEAESELTEVDLVPVIQTEASSEVQEGYVISTDPEAGVVVQVGGSASGEVTVVVSAGPDAIEMPDVIDEEQADAERTVREAGLTPVIETEASADVEEGRVISTDPAPGDAVEVTADGSAPEVTLVVSAGPDSLEVPDVIGMTVEQATNALEAAGFQGYTTLVTEVNVPGYSAGEVVSIDPGVGSSAEVNQSFRIEVASGSVPVPNLEGLTQEEANSALRDAGLNGNFQQIPQDEVPAGTVWDWDPKGTVEQGTTITVYIATEPEPEPSESETTTEPPDDDGGDGDGGGEGDG